MILDLGKYRFTIKGAYDSNSEYEYLDVVTLNNKTYSVVDENGVLAGETPTISGKWEKIFEASVISFNPNKIIYSDDNGDVKELSISNGMVVVNDGKNLEIEPKPITSYGGVKKLIKNNIPYQVFGFGFIDNDDVLKVTGQSNAYRFFNPTQSNRANIWEAMFEDDISVNGIENFYCNTVQGYFALDKDGRMFVAGMNNVGQLGTGNTTNVIGCMVEIDTTNIDAGDKIIDVCPAYSVTLILTDTGKVYSCGQNTYHRTGTGSSTGNTLSFTKIFDETSSSIKAIGLCTPPSNQYGGFALLTDEVSDNMYVWGRNAYGNLGTGNTVEVNTPTKVIVGSNEKITKVRMFDKYSSYDNGMLLTASGKIFSTGYNNTYQIGDNSATQRTSWTQTADGFSGYTDIFGIDGTTGSRFAITANKKLRAWGYNGNGVLGLGNSTNTYEPTECTDTGFQGKVLDMCVLPDYRYNEAYLITTDGFVYRCGLGGTYDGEPDNNTAVNVFTKVKGVKNVVSMAVSGTDDAYSFYALRNDGKVYIWGKNSYCEVGLVAGVVEQPTISQNMK